MFDWFSFVCSDAMRKMELVASSTGSEPQISHASDTSQKWIFQMQPLPPEFTISNSSTTTINPVTRTCECFKMASLNKLVDVIDVIVTAPYPVDTIVSPSRPLY